MLKDTQAIIHNTKENQSLCCGHTHFWLQTIILYCDQPLFSTGLALYNFGALFKKQIHPYSPEIYCPTGYWGKKYSTGFDGNLCKGVSERFWNASITGINEKISQDDYFEIDNSNLGFMCIFVLVSSDIFIKISLLLPYTASTWLCAHAIKKEYDSSINLEHFSKWLLD